MYVGVRHKTRAERDLFCAVFIPDLACKRFRRLELHGKLGHSDIGQYDGSYLRYAFHAAHLYKLIPRDRQRNNDLLRADGGAVPTGINL